MLAKTLAHRMMLPRLGWVFQPQLMHSRNDLIDIHRYLDLVKQTCKVNHYREETAIENPLKEARGRVWWWGWGALIGYGKDNTRAWVLSLWSPSGPPDAILRWISNRQKDWLPSAFGVSHFTLRGISHPGVQLWSNLLLSVSPLLQ